jgi:hypothetical protein
VDSSLDVFLPVMKRQGRIYFHKFAIRKHRGIKPEELISAYYMVDDIIKKHHECGYQVAGALGTMFAENRYIHGIVHFTFGLQMDVDGDCMCP